MIFKELVSTLAFVDSSEDEDDANSNSELLLVTLPSSLASLELELGSALESEDGESELEDDFPLRPSEKSAFFDLNKLVSCLPNWVFGTLALRENCLS